MALRKSKYSKKESKYAKDIAKIMSAGTGPYTRTMLADKLAKLHPELYKQELMNEISFAILQDRYIKKNRFRMVKRGWWELTEKQ